MQRSGSLHVIACVLAVPHVNPSSNKSFLPLLESCCSCTVDNCIGTRWWRRCAVECAAATDASSSSVHCTHTLYNPMHNCRSAYSYSRCLEHVVEANSVHPTNWTNALGEHQTAGNYAGSRAAHPTKSGHHPEEVIFGVQHMVLTFTTLSFVQCAFGSSIDEA